MSTPSTDYSDDPLAPRTPAYTPDIESHDPHGATPTNRTLQPQSVFNENRSSNLPSNEQHPNTKVESSSNRRPSNSVHSAAGTRSSTTGSLGSRIPRGSKRQQSIYSFLSDASVSDDGGDNDYEPVHLATFAPDVDENDVANLAAIPILAFLDAHRQPCAIIPLPTSIISSAASSSSESSAFEPLAETIWANLTFFSVTRGRQLVECLGPEEARAFTRWVYGPEAYVNGPPGTTGGAGDLGYYQGVDLALSPTLTVTLHAGTSAPTTLELCRTTSPSTPHLILTSHIITNRPNIISYASKLRAGSTVSASSRASMTSVSPTPIIAVGPFGSSIKDTPIPMDTPAPLFHAAAAVSTEEDLTPTDELRRSSVGSVSSASRTLSSTSSDSTKHPSPSLAPSPLNRVESLPADPEEVLARVDPTITFPEGVPQRLPLPEVSPDDPDLPDVASRTDPEMDAMRREFDRLFEIRSREITLLTEWAPVGMFCGSPDGLLTYVNKQFRELTNLHANPNDWPSIFVPADRTPLRHMWEECFRTGKQGSGEFQLMVGEGDAFAAGRSAHHVLIRLVGLTEGRGNSNSNPFVTGFVGTMIDISDRKDYETAQKRMNAERIDAWKARVDETEARRIEVEDSKKQQELLIDITSHEIRNPTSAIIAATDLLRSNINDMLSKVTIGSKMLFTPESVATLEDDILVLDSIHQSATIQERLSNDILRLAQIDLELLQVFPMEFNIVNETRRLLRIFEIEASQKGIKLKLHYGPSFAQLGELVEADPVRLNQITMNLISNAVKFVAVTSNTIKLIEVTVNVSLVGPPTPESPPTFNLADLNAPLTQELVNGRHDGYIYVEVKDSGGGMSLEDQGHLFQRFKQGNAKVHTAVGGSGLGLFVCKEMTRLQGGRIDIISTLDEGTTFRFYIKAGLFPPTDIPREIASPPPVKAVHRVPIASDAVLSILVVEDNPVNRKVLHRQFKRLLYHVEVAEHGLEALTILKSYALAGERFDMVLMDLEMPVLDGISALREIRSLEKRGLLPGHQPCISVSGNARQGQLDAAREAGADACITKPYKFPVLCQKIKETIYHRAGIALDGQEDLVGWMPQEALLSPGSEFIGNPFSPPDDGLHRSEWLDPGISPSTNQATALPTSSSTVSMDELLNQELPKSEGIILGPAMSSLASSSSVSISDSLEKELKE